jgi:Domain of Unknown Function (DUF1080)
MQSKPQVAALVILGLSGLAHHTGAGETTARKSEDGQWTPIFNGRDLAGWYTFVDGKKKGEDPQKVVQVHDGMIHMYKDATAGAPAPMAYVATDRQFENYDLRFEYRWGEKKFGDRAADPRDAGLIYHFVGEDKIWPRGIECQVQEQDTGDIFAVWTRVSSTVASGTQTYLSPEEGGVPISVGSSRDIARIQRSKMLEVGGWNKVEVRVRGGGATHIVNGQVNNRWTDLLQPDPGKSDRFIPLNKGKLLLQAEGAEIFYRNIEIRELPKAARQP